MNIFVYKDNIEFIVNSDIFNFVNELTFNQYKQNAQLALTQIIL